MLDANADVKVFSVHSDQRQAMSVTRHVAGELAVLSARLDAPAPAELEVVYLPPVRAMSPGQSTGRPQGGLEGEGRPGGGRGGFGGERGSRGGREGMGASSGRSEFYAKYAALSKGESLKSKPNEAMKVDFFPKWDGESLSLIVLDDGNPADQCRVTVSGPGEWSETGETELGIVSIPVKHPGRYMVEVRISVASTDAAQPSGGPVSRIGTLTLDLK
ncbi:DUF4198 domain-containing protein [Caulifigura coniformis]|nr:DUF4198 domain-containing protein [Caulifigura coniformis]